MDPFAAIMVGGLAFLLVALLLIGRFYPGTGAEVLDWKPTRSPELEAQNEADDLYQMLEAANERRRRRGQEDLTEQDIQDRIDADKQLRLDLAKRAFETQDSRADEEILQVLEAKNLRRKRQGLPEVTIEEYREQMRERALGHERAGSTRKGPAPKPREIIEAPDPSNPLL